MIKKVKIYGMVTGVFFRFFTRQNAKRLGLKGFVKNVGDHLEAIFEGDEKAIDEMIEICKRGPPGSKVKDVDIKTVTDYIGTFDDFEIL